MSRILLVANYPSDVGYAWWLIENYWAEIAQWSARQGRECVLAYPEITTIPAAIRDAPIETVEIAFDFSTRMSRAAIRELIRSREITSVYLTDQAPVSAHFAWLRLQGVRRIVAHDHTPGDRSPARGVSKAMKTAVQALGILSASRYIAVSDFVRDRLISAACVRPSRCVTVQNGIPTGAGSRARRALLRRELGIPDAQTVVLCVSRATLYKGIDFMIEVADRVRSRGIDGVTFLHCGDGEDLEHFRSIVRDRALEDRFILAGHRGDARDVMHSADIAIQPSLGEAHCLAILEYMDAALPVVVPDRRSVSQDVTHGENGLIYHAERAEEAADAVVRLHRDPSERGRMGSNGQALVRDRFTLAAANARFIEAIEGQL